MMTAAAALEAGVGHARRRRSRTSARCGSTAAGPRSTTPNRKGMGWITFEDGIAYSRNVVAAKVALRLGKTTGESSAMLYDTWVAARATGADRDRPRRRGRAASCATPASSRGARSTSPTARSARAWPSPRSSSRPRTRRCSTAATLVQPHVVKAIGDRRCRDRDAAAGSSTRRSRRTLVGLMDHVIDEVPFYRDRTHGPGLRRRRQDRHGADLGRRSEQGPRRWKDNLFNYSFVGYIARQNGVPDLVVAVRIEEGTPTVARVGPAGDAGHVVRALPAHRHQRHHDARTCSATDPHRPSRGVGPATGRPVTRGACDDSAPVTGDAPTLPTDPTHPAVRPAPGLHGRRPRPPDRRPACSPAPTDPSAAPPSTRGWSRPGNLFVALPGRADRRPRTTSARRSPAARPRCS